MYAADAATGVFALACSADAEAALGCTTAEQLLAARATLLARLRFVRGGAALALPLHTTPAAAAPAAAALAAAAPADEEGAYAARVTGAGVRGRGGRPVPRRRRRRADPRAGAGAAEGRLLPCSAATAPTASDRPLFEGVAAADAAGGAASCSSRSLSSAAR